MSFERESISMILASNGVNQPASNFTTNLQKPLRLNNGKWAMAITNLQVWNTAPNISAALGNNYIYVTNDGGSTYTKLTFPDGIYTVQNIIDSFSNLLTIAFPNGGMPQTAIVLEINNPLITTQFVINNNWGVNFAGGSGTSLLYEILGFALSQNLVNTSGNPVTYVGINEANVTNGVSAYLVHCNVIDASASYVNGNPSDVIFVYSPASAPGSLVSYIPTFPIFLNCSSMLATSINITITDQLNRPVTLNTNGQYNNNPTSVQLLFIRKGEDVAHTESLVARNEKQMKPAKSMMIK